MWDPSQNRRMTSLFAGWSHPVQPRCSPILPCHLPRARSAVFVFSGVSRGALVSLLRFAGGSVLAAFLVVARGLALPPSAAFATRAFGRTSLQILTNSVFLPMLDTAR